MNAPFPSRIEALEARIAPAAALVSPLPDLVGGIGSTGATIDLTGVFGSGSAFRTKVELTTNFDTDPNTPGLQAGVIVLELFDDLTPLTVQNFLSYVNGSARGDLDGTFFHRLAAGFVLQLGGFEATNPSNHIPVGADLHNEFLASNSNVAGTIAMAKVGTGPNTATSEFFFNLANNSGNLDNQNGGFTVFGKVVSGMDVVTAIATQPAKDFSLLNSALSSVPVNPSYLAKPANAKPAAADFITVTGAHVLAPGAGDAMGATFEVVSILDGATHAATDLLSYKLGTDNKLALQYNTAKTGTALVKIKISQPGEADAFEEFSVTLKPNLVTSQVSTTLPGAIVPGDSGLVKFKISNSAASLAKGLVDVKFYLSKVSSATDPSGVILDASDVEIGSLLGQSISVAGGKSVTLSAKVNIPQQLVSVGGEQYRIITQVTPSEGSPIEELFTDDNTSLNGSGHQEYNAFGSFLGRKNVSLTYHDANGSAVTFSLKGPGYSQLTGSLAAGVDMNIFDTTAASSVSVKVLKSDAAPSGQSLVHKISTFTTIGALNLGALDVNGNVEIASGAKSLTLGNLSNPDGTEHHIKLGYFHTNPNQSATVKLGSVSDYSLTANMRVGALSAQEWVNVSPVREDIFAVALKSLVIQGNLEANLNANFDKDEVLYSKTKLARLSVGGSLEGAVVSVGGDLTKVTLGAMDGSTLYVGVTVVGDQFTDYGFNGHTLGSFTLKSATAGLGVFADSVIAAQRINTLVIQSVGTGGGPAYGVTVEAIKSYLRGDERLNNPADGLYDVQGSYSLKVS